MLFDIIWEPKSILNWLVFPFPLFGFCTFLNICLIGKRNDKEISTQSQNFTYFVLHIGRE